MSDYKGDFSKGRVVRHLFSTFAKAGGNLAPSNAFEAADVRCYVDGGTTQITAGITVTSPYDGVGAAHLVEIDLGNAAYLRGTDVEVVLVPDETVDSEVFSFVSLFSFSIENRAPAHGGFRAKIATLTSQTEFTVNEGPAEPDGLNGWAALIKDAAGVHQYALAGVSDWNGGTLGVTLDADPGIFTMAVGDTVEFIPAFANAGLSTQSQTDVQTAVTAALTAMHLDHLFGAAYDPASKPGAAAALLNTLVENDGGVPRFTVNALEQGPSGGGGGGATAEQVRIEMDTNSTRLAAIVADTNELQVSLAEGGAHNNLIDALGVIASAIQAKTDQLTFSVPGRVDSNVKSVVDEPVGGGGGQPWSRP
ncbi:MAG: hypothetical protein AAF529_14570 [Pseudomonadota bacterium]